MFRVDRLRVGWLNGFSFITSRGAASADDTQGTPTQSHISPSILVYEDYREGFREEGLGFGTCHTTALAFVPGSCRAQGLGLRLRHAGSGG